jgi:hypothetical protein
MELMKVKGSKILSNTWKQEMTITDEGVESEILVVGKRKKKFITYDRIAQVNLSNGLAVSDLEVVNSGGGDNIIVKAVNKKVAKEAKELIDKKVKENTTRTVRTESIIDIPSQIKKLSELKEQGIITVNEFEKKKGELLSKM